MKKLLWSLCVIAVLLSAFCLGLTAAYITSDYSTEEFSYEQIKGSNADPHPQSAHFIHIFYEGDFPGMSDTPVSAERAEPGKKVLNALQGQTYTRLFPLIRPSKKGIGIHEVSGCTPLIPHTGTANIYGFQTKGAGGATPPPTRTSCVKRWNPYAISNI